MRETFRTLITALWLCAAAPAAAAAESPTYAFTSGRWWDGAKYVSTTMYVVDGQLRLSAPARVDETLDLHDQFVIPPLAEGHNHWLEPTQVDAYNACYLADGVYYVKDMSNAPWIVDQIRDKVNLPTSVEFVTAMQGFTGPESHPIEIVDYFVKAGIFPTTWQPPYDPEAEFVVRTKYDVDERFEQLLAERPGYVKIFLLYSEEYEKRLHDPAMYGNHRGIDPKLVPYIVELAHAAHLKAMAHVYTVPDFRTALAAGVDGIQHLPGLAYDPRLSLDHYRLTPADASAAKRRDVTVTPTVYGLGTLKKDDPKHQKLIRDELVIPNLKLLKDRGVRVLLGSDQFRHSPLTELLTLRDTGVYSNAELLEMATFTTPTDIFPTRKIGRLKDGYEASFLVLAQDPLKNLDNLKSISLRVKQGHRLALPASAIERRSAACVE